MKASPEIGDGGDTVHRSGVIVYMQVIMQVDNNNFTIKKIL